MRQWQLWLDWLKETAGARVYVAVALTGWLGLRMGEALALKREDVQLNGAIPKISVTGEAAGARKSPGDVYVRKQHLGLVRGILARGVEVQRTIKHKHGKGRCRTIAKKDVYKVPARGYLFPSRAKAGRPHLHYAAIYKHVVREGPRFAKHLADVGEAVSPEVARLRPHSGRATVITELMGEGLTTAMSMKYARHAPSSYKVHLRYGQLSLQDVKDSCDGLRASRPKTAWSKVPLKGLLQAQKAIANELAHRLKK